MHLWPSIEAKVSLGLPSTTKPKAHEKFKAEGMIIEIRGNRHCTVFPGSVHESGETIEFENPDNYDPFSFDLEGP